MYIVNYHPHKNLILDLTQFSLGDRLYDIKIAGDLGLTGPWGTPESTEQESE